MQKPSWKDIAELTGIAAIVASLIFVGLQMQQEQEIAIVDTYGSLTESTENLADLVDRNVEIWRKGLNGEELSSGERIKFLALAKAVQIHFSNISIRYARIGPGDPNWVARNYAYALYTYPGLRKAREIQRQPSPLGPGPMSGGFSSTRMEERVDSVLKELDDAAIPIPTEKTYVFW